MTNGKGSTLMEEDIEGLGHGKGSTLMKENIEGLGHGKGSTLMEEDIEGLGHGKRFDTHGGGYRGAWTWKTVRHSWRGI
jgi:hypothetical protein